MNFTIHYGTLFKGAHNKIEEIRQLPKIDQIVGKPLDPTLQGVGLLLIDGCRELLPTVRA